jgi:predicted metal-dependent hydrolase
VPYALRRSARRSIGFTIGPDGLRVSAPRWVAQGEIEAALQTKADWILRKLGQVQDRERRLSDGRVDWADGVSLPYLGAPLQIRLAPQAQASALTPAGSSAAGVLHLALPAQAEATQIRDATQAWLQGQARRLFEQRCQHFAPLLGVRYTRLALSSAQTRWGSATAQGHIRLNWRLIHLPLASIDYVVAHELAHLREMNHSPRFWAVVESVVPDYQTLRGQLRHETLPLWD